MCHSYLIFYYCVYLLLILCSIAGYFHDPLKRINFYSIALRCRWKQIIISETDRFDIFLCVSYVFFHITACSRYEEAEEVSVSWKNVHCPAVPRLPNRYSTVVLNKVVKFTAYFPRYRRTSRCQWTLYHRFDCFLVRASILPGLSLWNYWNR